MTRISSKVLLLFYFQLCLAQNNEEKIDLSQFGVRLFGIPKENSVQSRAMRSRNPEENGPYLEGDLLMPITERNGIQLQAARWPNREIPYVISQGFTQNEIKTIHKALNEYRTKTCIKFIPKRASDRDFISIESEPTGCWSSIGRLGGKQVVNLQTRLCLETLGTPIHELLHAVGFTHEQNREDRDTFVRINLQNIQRGKEQNFDKAKPGTSSSYGVAYDYGSVMHYSEDAFSSNGKPTIEAKLKTNLVMGQREGFTRSDIEKIKRMYKC